MNKGTKVISVRLSMGDYSSLKMEADNRMMTTSELIRVIIEQRHRINGSMHGKWMERIENLLNKILYHGVRSDVGHIAQFKMQDHQLAARLAVLINKEAENYNNYEGEEEGL